MSESNSSDSDSDSSKDEDGDEEGTNRKTDANLAATLADSVLGIVQLDEGRFFNCSSKKIHGGRAGVRRQTRCGLNTENFQRMASAGAEVFSGEEKMCKRCFVSRTVGDPNPIELEYANHQAAGSSGSPSKASQRLAAEFEGRAVSPTQEASDDEGFDFSPD